MPDRLSAAREAEIRARAKGAKGLLYIEESFLRQFTHGEAAFMRHGYGDIIALLAELDAVRQERDEARANVVRAHLDQRDAYKAGWKNACAQDCVTWPVPEDVADALRAENARLAARVEAAPHAEGCPCVVIPGRPCDCWKDTPKEPQG